MKKLSIKMKVTLWYTGLITIIMALVLAFVFTSSDKLLFAKMEGQLEHAVQESVEELDEEHGHGHLDVDEVEYYDDGIYLLIYDEQGSLISGRTPADFTLDTPFQLEQLRTIENNNQEWLVYDLKWETRQGESF